MWAELVYRAVRDLAKTIGIILGSGILAIVFSVLFFWIGHYAIGYILKQPATEAGLQWQLYASIFTSGMGFCAGAIVIPFSID